MLKCIAFVASLATSIVNFSVFVGRIDASKGTSGWFYSGGRNLESQLSNPSSNWYQSKISLSLARKITIGRSQVKVGIIDTGIDNSHDLLSTNYDSSLSVSFSENTNDAYYNNPYVYGTNQYFHGTGVAGIISPSLDSNGNYVMGINSKVKLISIRADGPINNNPFNDPFHETYSSISNSMDYANQLIDIINFSGGFDTYDNSTMRSKFQNYDGLAVVAAGNNNWDLDTNNSQNKVYPANYTFDNIIVVGASTETDEKQYDSNYGVASVDLFAPGDSLVSTTFNNSYEDFGYTSGAAPMVAGVAAMIKSVNPALTPTQIKNIIMSNVDYVSNLSDKCVSGGRLNAYKAVRAAIPQYTTLGLSMPSLYTLSQGDTQWYKFNAMQNAVYQIWATGSLATKGYLYENISQNPVVSGTPGGFGSNFYFTYTPSTNKTVYICVENVSSASGTPSLMIYSSHTHYYNNSYYYLNQSSHLSYCSCGDYIVSPHAISTESNGYCVLCGAYIGGPIHNDPFCNDDDGGFGNGSYIREDGIIVLDIQDVSAFINGELNVPQVIEEEDDCCE